MCSLSFSCSPHSNGILLFFFFQFYMHFSIIKNKQILVLKKSLSINCLMIFIQRVLIISQSTFVFFSFLFVLLSRFYFFLLRCRCLHKAYDAINIFFFTYLTLPYLSLFFISRLYRVMLALTLSRSQDVQKSILYVILMH